MADQVDVENIPSPSGNITDDDRLWALLGYVVPIVALLALLLEEKKDRAFIRYHAIHALIMAVIILITSFTVCGWILAWAYSIYLGIQAYQGQWVTVPFLTDFARSQGWLSE